MSDSNKVAGNVWLEVVRKMGWICAKENSTNNVKKEKYSVVKISLHEDGSSLDEEWLCFVCLANCKSDRLSECVQYIISKEWAHIRFMKEDIIINALIIV
jgi:hypothetical protein